jgi:hypothetical protein
MVELATVPELEEDTVVADGMDLILSRMTMEDTDSQMVIWTVPDLDLVHTLEAIGKRVRAEAAEPRNRVRPSIQTRQ